MHTLQATNQLIDQYDQYAKTVVVIIENSHRLTADAETRLKAELVWLPGLRA